MLRILSGWILVIVLLFCVGMIPAVIQRGPSHASPEKPMTTEATRSDPYTPHIPPRAFAYIHTQRTLGLLGMVWNLVGMGLFVRSGGAARLRTDVYKLFKRPLPEEDGPPPLLLLLVFYALYSLLVLLWNLPFGTAELATEWRFGFSQESLSLYLRDGMMNWAIGMLFALLIYGIYRLANRSPRRWWLWMWGVTLPLLIGILILQPIVLAPMFYKYTRLPDGPLRAQILEMAARAGAPHADVFVEDTHTHTTHVNAYVTGVGPAARIVINDTAIHSLPQDQLLAMLGHETGHYVEKHIWYGLLSGALGAGLFYYLAFRLLPVLDRRLRNGKTGLRSSTDLATLPLLLFYLQIALLIQDPIANLESRYMEHRADAFGLRVTGLHDATARLMVGFAERDYTDPDPPALLHFWFGSHPTIKERIAFALSGEVKPRIAPRAHP